MSIKTDETGQQYMPLAECDTSMFEKLGYIDGQFVYAGVLKDSHDLVFIDCHGVDGSDHCLAVDEDEVIYWSVQEYQSRGYDLDMYFVMDINDRLETTYAFDAEKGLADHGTFDHAAKNGPYVIFPQHECAAMVFKGVLYTTPIDEHGTMDTADGPLGLIPNWDADAPMSEEFYGDAMKFFPELADNNDDRPTMG